MHDYKHAAAILFNEFPDLATDICEALRVFRFTKEHILKPGGNESEIPKSFSSILRKRKWLESQLSVKIIVDDREVQHDTHKVDYLKGRVAFDLEWNSKDQTFDRDLYAFKTFFDYDKISVAILVTRSNELDPYFTSLGTYTNKAGKLGKVKTKYGASTTHLGKLLPRLNAGRNGGCPVLVFGITPRLLAT